LVEEAEMRLVLRLVTEAAEVAEALHSPYHY
jgi:hypothetical protein